MKTKTKIVWRLKEQPTSEMLRELVKDGILTKDEAREVLFSSEEQADRNIESFKSEIEFLRELVEKLSCDKGQIITTIREIEKPYNPYPWYQPYFTWCGTTDITSSSTTSSTSETSCGFNSITTF